MDPLTVLLRAANVELRRTLGQLPASPAGEAARTAPVTPPDPAGSPPSRPVVRAT